MNDGSFSRVIDVPPRGEWPGAVEAYNRVKAYIKPQIWNFVSLIGLVLIVDILAKIILGILFKRSGTDELLNEVVAVFASAIFQASTVTMYFKSLNGDDFTLGEVISYGYNRTLKMIGLLIVMYVLLAVSFILLVVPFIFLLPRLYLAPYFLIYNDSTVSEALAASWHLSKGHFKEVWSILLINLALALLALTIIGIPFAVYWWTINTGSFALLTMHLSLPKKVNKKKSAGKKVTA